MNPFDPKVALLEKHEQHPVIDPHRHGSEQGPNVWLANSKLPHLGVLVGMVSSSSLVTDLLFF
jgi:hypothetical protein